MNMGVGSAAGGLAELRFDLLVEGAEGGLLRPARRSFDQRARLVQLTLIDRDDRRAVAHGPIHQRARFGRALEQLHEACTGVVTIEFLRAEAVG